MLSSKKIKEMHIGSSSHLKKKIIGPSKPTNREANKNKKIKMGHNFLSKAK